MSASRYDSKFSDLRQSIHNILRYLYVSGCRKYTMKVYLQEMYNSRTAGLDYKAKLIFPVLAIGTSLPL